jgi:hypothetical protein
MDPLLLFTEYLGKAKWGPCPPALQNNLSGSKTEWRRRRNFSRNGGGQNP